MLRTGNSGRRPSSQSKALKPWSRTEYACDPHQIDNADSSKGKSHNQERGPRPIRPIVHHQTSELDAGTNSRNRQIEVLIAANAGVKVHRRSRYFLVDAEAPAGGVNAAYSADICSF